MWTKVSEHHRNLAENNKKQSIYISNAHIEVLLNAATAFKRSVVCGFFQSVSLMFDLAGVLCLFGKGPSDHETKPVRTCIL